MRFAAGVPLCPPILSTNAAVVLDLLPGSASGQRLYEKNGFNGKWPEVKRYWSVLDASW
jgi:hypothetical protein